MLNPIFAVCVAFIVVLLVQPVQAQKPSAGSEKIIFSVLNDGKMLEPLALLRDKKLIQPVSGADDPALIKKFAENYYRPNTKYKLVFGGALAGSVSVNSSDPASECSANMALTSYLSRNAKLKGKVMALATNADISPKAIGTRRLPTRKERAEVESLVRKRFADEGVAAKTIASLKYQNLTALDVDNDGIVEFVGTFWLSPSAKSRSLLFVIVDQTNGNKFSFGFSDLTTLKESEVMSGDIGSVDDGVYHELLLDILDVDGDGVSEIFTYRQSFEGSGFNAYQRSEKGWVNIYEGSNYHCGY